MCVLCMGGCVVDVHSVWNALASSIRQRAAHSARARARQLDHKRVMIYDSDRRVRLARRDTQTQKFVQTRVRTRAVVYMPHALSV